MKLITKVIGMSAIFLFALIVSGSGQTNSTVLEKKFTHYMVQLDADWDSGALRIKKDGKCKNENHKGCLLFHRNHEGYITFYLKSKPKLETCDTANEVISLIEVATTGTEDPAKGDYSGRRDKWVKENAFETINLQTGVVFPVPPMTPSTRVTLKNLNSQTFEEMGDKQFWYRVTVKSCSDPSSTITTDPRGDNEGKNKN